MARPIPLPLQVRPIDISEEFIVGFTSDRLIFGQVLKISTSMKGQIGDDQAKNPPTFSTRHISRRRTSPRRCSRCSKRCELYILSRYCQDTAAPSTPHAR